MKNLATWTLGVLLSTLALASAGCSHFDDDDDDGGGGASGASSNSDLTALVLSVTSLDQPFDASRTFYTATCANGFDSTTVTPSSASGSASVTVNGMPVASGTESPPIALVEGDNDIVIVVTSADTTTMTTYEVEVTRLPAAGTDADLVSLQLSAGAVDPLFDPATVMYTLTVAAGVTETTVTPTTSSATATVTVDGVALASGTASGPIALVEGVNTITVAVTAEDGVTTKNYLVDVTRLSDASLSALALSAGPIDPTFDPAVFDYTATVPFTAATTTVTATAASATATILVNGDPVTSGMPSDPIALAEGINTIVVDVTGGNGTTMRDYLIEVTRRPGTSFGDEGYFKASNTDEADQFGFGVALSADGRTLAVGAVNEESATVGVNGDESDNGSMDSGAVYVFARVGTGPWTQQAYVKASNTGPLDEFGSSVALSENGDTLIVGAWGEDSGSTGVNGDQSNTSGIQQSGAAYVFVRDSSDNWSQQAYLKASNTDTTDWFGTAVALSGDGNLAAVGARQEDGGSAGVNGDDSDNSVFDAGAVYVFVRDGGGSWSQEAYLKASNPGFEDEFGRTVALSAMGDTLAVGADREDSIATGIGGDQSDDSGLDAGAAYVFVRDGGGTWTQQAYVKASNTGLRDQFGFSVDLSESGDTLAVGSFGEDSTSTGVNGDQNADSGFFFNSGAAYVFTRDGGGAWSQQAYVKSSTTAQTDWFGSGIAVYGDTLAVSAPRENNQEGAVHLYLRDGAGVWTHEMRIQPQVRDFFDGFGGSGVNNRGALSLAGGVLAVGSFGEDSLATGIGTGQTDDSAPQSGAAYVFE